MKEKNEWKQLKREISKRWYVMCEELEIGERPPATLAQLEYILQEAGLLVKQRKFRRKYYAKLTDETADENLPQHTLD
jgi:hypothetical protein